MLHKFTKYPMVLILMYIHLGDDVDMENTSQTMLGYSLLSTWTTHCLARKESYSHIN